MLERDGRGGGGAIAQVFDAAFADFAELVQPFPTYGRRGPEGMELLSRLDRFYSNISEFEAAGQFWSVATEGSLHSEERPSDHLPVVLRISAKPSRTARLPRLSQELVKTQEYQCCLERLMRGGGGRGRRRRL